MRGLLIALGLVVSTSAMAAKTCETQYGSAALSLEAAKRAAAEHDGTLLGFSGERGARLLKIVNDEPPESEEPADHLIVVVFDDQFRMALVNDGCVTQIMSGPKDMWDRFMKKLDGAAS